MKPLMTEPPLNLPVTREDKIEWKRYQLYKQGLLDDEQQHDALLEQEHEWMQLLDDEEYL
jgi:hypothetical protein